jgi:hypothetical protein
MIVVHNIVGDVLLGCLEMGRVTTYTIKKVEETKQEQWHGSDFLTTGMPVVPY